jgi:hypothetical protein
MKKQQLFGIAALALGIAAVAKLIYDIRTIKKLTEEKEDELALEAAIAKVLDEEAVVETTPTEETVTE